MSRHILKSSILIVLSTVSCSVSDGVADEAMQAPATTESKRLLPKTSNNPSVQQLVEVAINDLDGRLGQRVDEEIVVVQAEQVTWRSSAIGCPQPDRGYLMSLRPGVLIRLRAAGQVYEYHSTLRGPPFLCEPPARIETPAPPNSSLDPT